jgi:hypothetical protein
MCVRASFCGPNEFLYACICVYACTWPTLLGDPDVSAWPEELLCRSGCVYVCMYVCVYEDKCMAGRAATQIWVCVCVCVCMRIYKYVSHINCEIAS